MTREDVLRVARRYVDPVRMAVIVVGDREKVGASVEALGLGDLRALTVADVLGPPPVMPTP